jgi:hypothetical protein
MMTVLLWIGGVLLALVVGVIVMIALWARDYE